MIFGFRHVKWKNPLPIIVLFLSCVAALSASAFSVRPKLTTRSPDLDATVVTSWGPQKHFFVEKELEIVTWEKAKELLLDGNARGGKQYHTGWVTIYNKDGTGYLTKPPKMDAIFEFLRAHHLKSDGFAPE